MNGSRLEILERLIQLFWTGTTYEKELVYEVTWTSNNPCNVVMEYSGKFWHTPRRINHIVLLRIIDIFYTSWQLGTQTVAPAPPGFQGLKRCINYLDIKPNKPIFCHFISYDGSNVIIITWSGKKVEEQSTHNYL